MYVGVCVHACAPECMRVCVEVIYFLNSVSGGVAYIAGHKAK